jgi:hypothetical protein
MIHQYYICFFDVLGFKSIFNQIGIEAVYNKYMQLTQIIDSCNNKSRYMTDINFIDGAYWTIEGVRILHNVYGAYASDSILLFAYANFPPNRQRAEIGDKADDPQTGWMYHPIPCDNFLSICNEIMCHSIEIGLPLRGALSIGDAILDLEQNVFLGHPLIEGVNYEKNQRCIGVGFTSSFMKGIIPERYKILFNRHLKKEDVHDTQNKGFVLDWPRHWRKTRRTDLIDALKKLNLFDDCCNITKEIITISNDRKHLFETPEYTRIENVYPQFSSRKLALPIRLCRSLPRSV